MQILKTQADINSMQQNMNNGSTLGFVPTMGALHAGHEALIRQAQQEADIVIVSIFVNPTQFNDNRDFEKYPKNDAEDFALLKKLGVDYVFVPGVADMYPQGNDYQVTCSNSHATTREGAKRPGHFNGMLTIVLKLLLLIQPTYAYFGEKDYQQAQLVIGLVKDFFLPTVIRVCDTVRHESGLPHSSRLKRLTEAQQQQLHDLYKRLQEIDHNDIDTIENLVRESGLKVDYVEREHNRTFLAMHLGDIRLIDIL